MTALYRSGIQLSCASQGVNKIHDNTITNCGYEYDSNGQGSGISLGGYTQANFYNNTITNTYTMGISSLGAGPLIIKNNIVKNSGIISWPLGSRNGKYYGRYPEYYSGR